MNEDHLMMACGPLDHRTILKDTSVLSFATEDSINDIPLSKILINIIYIAIYLQKIKTTKWYHPSTIHVFLRIMVPPSFLLPHSIVGNVH